MIQFREFEAKLATLHEIQADDMAAFGAKLKALRVAGVPNIVPTGKGKRLAYSAYDLWETHLALSLVVVGLPPVKVVQFIKDYVRVEGLLAKVKATDKELYLLVDTYLSAGKSAHYGLTTYETYLYDVDELANYFRETADPYFKLIVNITDLTREIK